MKSVSNGVVEHLEAKAEEEEPPFGMGAGEFEAGEENAGGEEEETADEEEEEEEDVSETRTSCVLVTHVPPGHRDHHGPALTVY